MSKHQSHNRLRKRTTTKNTLVDRVTYVVAIVEPIITIPQAATIFVHRTAAGISLSTWIGYEVLTFVWLWYAVAHKDRLIFLYQVLYFFVQTAVIIGGLMYGAKW
jgi:uncharacterized protein with PQ loop repeat